MCLKGSCGLPNKASQGTLELRVRNDRGELESTNQQALQIVLDLEASAFSVGSLNEKGVKLDLLSNPSVVRDGNDVFPISTKVPQTFVLRI